MSHFSYMLLFIILLFNSISTYVPLRHRCQYHKHRTPKLEIHVFKRHKEEITVSSLNSTIIDKNNTDKINNTYTNSSYGPMRILIDYSNYKVTKAVHKQISKHIITKVINVINKYFQIYRNNTFMRFHAKKCYEAKVPKSHRTTGFNNVDLVLYFSSGYDNSSQAVAWASPCFVDDETGRPIAAQVYLNLYYLKQETYSEVSMVLLHELMHVLGFDYDYFGKFQYPNGTKIPKNQIYKKSEPNNLIIVPELIELAKNYFNCSKIEGIPLEKGMGDGSDNSHWAQEFFEQDIMSPVEGINEIISNFTLGFFNSTGWYKITYNNRSMMTWGKGKGCQIIRNQCYSQKYEYGEYCFNLAERGCTPDHRFISVCWNSYSGTHCPLNYATQYCTRATKKYNQTDYQYFGAIQTSGSKCFNVDIAKSNYYNDDADSHNDAGHKCLLANCFTKDNGEKAINISIYNITLECNKSNVWISPEVGSHYSGIVYCPDIEKFCQIYPEECIDGCNGNGVCVNGTCQCFDFISGDSCNDFGKKMSFNGTGLSKEIPNYKEQYYS